MRARGYRTFRPLGSSNPQGDNRRGAGMSRLELVERELAAAKARLAELERFQDSMRCPQCDHLRLELGQMRSERDALKALAGL
jgi:hypothetical protein